MLSYYIKLGLKRLGETPVLTLLILMAMALGIAVSVTMLALHHAMAYNPAEEKSGRLFAVQLAAYGNDMETWGEEDGLPIQVTHRDAMNLRESTIPLRQTPMFRMALTLESHRQDMPPSADFVVRVADRDFFEMFGVNFVYGGPWDKTIDLDTARVAVINQSVNEYAFGGGNNVGKILLMNETEYRVVGITEDSNPLPRYYDLTSGAYPITPDSVFIPYSLAPQLESFPNGNISGWAAEPVNEFADLLQTEFVWQVYWVELPDAQAVAAYRDYLAGYVDQQQQLGRFQNGQARGHIRDVQQWLTYNRVIKDDNRVMVGLSFMFLLVCLVNTVGLLLARFLRRMNETGVRRALGASKLQIFQQYITEVSLLGLLGGGAGLLLSMVGLWGIRSLYTQYATIAYLDATMVAAAVAISLASSLIAGTYPAYRVCAAQPSLFLKAQ
ncbi:FtsX-like permease family protein [Exilibacterium tricleocarpae]|uniref:FtsX-like permease family protein n=1 Tax=Exilibacterium tricleocarpae TaxID=2591008 RepID=A0A545SYX8_9GAMM|nr:ABC transporter permease [Exilibacterium tricleocarpae]TQV70175.1 FtsX-like permease family protein [Exilibacterium tricleocarpae]